MLRFTTILLMSASIALAQGGSTNPLAQAAQAAAAAAQASANDAMSQANRASAAATATNSVAQAIGALQVSPTASEQVIQAALKSMQLAANASGQVGLAQGAANLAQSQASLAAQNAALAEQAPTAAAAQPFLSAAIAAMNQAASFDLNAINAAQQALFDETSVQTLENQVQGQMTALNRKMTANYIAMSGAVNAASQWIQRQTSQTCPAFSSSVTLNTSAIGPIAVPPPAASSAAGREPQNPESGMQSVQVLGIDSSGCYLYAIDGNGLQGSSLTATVFTDYYVAMSNQNTVSCASSDAQACPGWTQQVGIASTLTLNVVNSSPTEIVFESQIPLSAPVQFQVTNPGSISYCWTQAQGQTCSLP